MNLFSQEKETIFKITNAVLLIWLVASIIILFSSIIDITVKDPVMNYEQYKLNNCSVIFYDDVKEDDSMKNCESQYENYKYENDRVDTYKLKSIYNSLANIIVVAGVMVFLNKKKKNK